MGEIKINRLMMDFDGFGFFWIGQVPYFGFGIVEVEPKVEHGDVRTIIRNPRRWQPNNE